MFTSISVLSLVPGQMFAMTPRARMFRAVSVTRDGSAVRIHATDAISGNTFVMVAGEWVRVTVAQ